MISKSYFLAFTLFVLTNISSALPVWAQNNKTILFGIVPQQAASKLAAAWVPFINSLSSETGYKIQFATMKDIPSFENCLAQAAYDVAYMNPYHYTTFSKESGYRAFAHQSNKKLKGLIVVHADSNAQELKDFDNQKLAFPSPAAFGASILPRAEMKAEGLAIEPVYVKSHDSVYRAVAAGIFPAGGGVQRTFNSIPDDLKSQLRVIYRTKEYTPHAFATNKNLTSDELQKISAAMMKISQTSPDLLKAIGMQGFQTASNENWDDVRALNLSDNETQIVHNGSIKCRLD